MEENQALVLSLGKLLAKASDADAGDTLSVTAAGPTSTNGPLSRAEGGRAGPGEPRRAQPVVPQVHRLDELGG